MKVLHKLTAILLSTILAISTIPVYAADNEKFISMDVEYIDSDNNIAVNEETFYSINDKLYVPVSFLIKYTPYYYNENINSFIRTNQPENSIWGQVKIDFEKKEAILTNNIYNKKTYKLSNIYKIDEEYFLPLTEMAALLKSEVKTNNHTLRIVNSGYSLADAEYALSILEDEKILSYDLDDVIDDVYAGSYGAFKASAIIDYLGSILVVKLENITFFSDFGSVDNYYEFFEKCVTDNDSYIESASKQDDLIGRFASTQKINKNFKDSTKKFGKYFGIIKDAVEPLKNSNENSYFLYTKTEDMNALFNTVSNVAEAADFILKVGSMCDDNKNMINNLRDNRTALEAHSHASAAIRLIAEHYGKDYITNVTTKLTTELGKEIVDKGIKKIPAVRAIKLTTTIIDEVSKNYLNLNITTNKEIKLMVNVDVKHILNNYFYDFRDYSINEKSSEEYRTAVIFYLLTCKHLYSEANEAAKQTISKDANLYEDEIKNIENVLQLFYAAMQSKKVDNFEGVDGLMRANSENIKKINIIENDVANLNSSNSTKLLEATKEEIEKAGEEQKVMTEHQ